MRDDSPSAPKAQQLVGYGILALLLMTVAGSTLDGTPGTVGTLALAAISLTCFALALRRSLRGSR